ATAFAIWFIRSLQTADQRCGEVFHARGSSTAILAVAPRGRATARPRTVRPDALAEWVILSLQTADQRCGEVYHAGGSSTAILAVARSGRATARPRTVRPDA